MVTPLEKAQQISRRAAHAAWQMSGQVTEADRVLALQTIAEEILADTDVIIAANAVDVHDATAASLSDALVDRLLLTKDRIASMAQAVCEIAAGPEVVGRYEDPTKRPNGLRVSKMRIPLGVVCMIYESRPNVTSDAAALCIKSGNAVILRGGKESLRSNLAIGAAVQRGLAKTGIPQHAVSVLDTADRQILGQLLQQEDSIDVVIPRGGEGLIRYVTDNAKIPVLKHYKGVCHVYVHSQADITMATNIVINAKTQRPGVCNALETLLVDKAIAPTFLPIVCDKLQSLGVTLRGDAAAVEIVGSPMTTAQEQDWHAEYLALTLAIRVVANYEQARAHIAQYGSNHTEAIVTEDNTTASRFLAEVPSSTVVHNASTRFADGGELGLGAEIGISTTKLHAYGPMGVTGLTTTKFVVKGMGQIRS